MFEKNSVQAGVRSLLRAFGFAFRLLISCGSLIAEPFLTLGPVKQLIRVFDPRSRVLLGLSALSRDSTFSGLVLPFLSFVVLDFGIPFFNPSKLLEDAIRWVIGGIITGLFNAISNLFVIGVSKFMFFQNPADIASLDVLYLRSLRLALAFLPLFIIVFFLVSQIFPSRIESEPSRMVERTIFAVIVMAIARPGVAFIVTATHSLSMFLYPETYNLMWGPTAFQGIVGGLGSAFAAVILAIFGGFSMVVSGLFFYGILIFRQLLVYMVYGLAPIFAVFWVIDVGPGKYARSLVDFIVTLTAFFLLFGVFASGILSVGAAVAGFTGGGAAATSGAGISAFDTVTDSFKVVFLKMFMYFGTLWLVVGLSTSLVGLAKRFGVNSVGTGVGKRIRAQRSLDSSPQPSSTSGTAAAVAGGGGFGGGGGGGGGGGFPIPGQSAGDNTKGPMQVQTLENGDLMLTNDQEDGVIFRDNPGMGPTAASFSDGEVDQVISGDDTFKDVSTADVATTADYEGAMSLSEKAAGIASRPRDKVAAGIERSGEAIEDQGFESFGGGIQRLGSGISEHISRQGVKSAGYYGATFGGLAAVDENSGPIHRSLGRGVRSVGRAVKGGAKTYGKMFAEEDPVRATKIGLNGMRRSPIGDPRRSNATGDLKDRYQQGFTGDDDDYGGRGSGVRGSFSNENLIGDLAGMSAYAFGADGGNVSTVGRGTREAAVAAAGGQSSLPEPSWDGASSPGGDRGWIAADDFQGQLVSGDQIRFEKAYGEDIADGSAGEVWAGTVVPDQPDEFTGSAGPYLVRPGNAESGDRAVVLGHNISGVRTQGLPGSVSEDGVNTVTAALSAGGISALGNDFDTDAALETAGLTSAQVDRALNHQIEMGVAPAEAAARVGRVLKYDAFDPVGQYSVSEDMASMTGTEGLPEALETDTAANRIRLAEDPSVSSGVNSNDMWRYTFADEDRAVFGQDVSESDYGLRTVVGEEALDEFGVNTPQYHYDPNQEFVRAEAIPGEDLDDIRKAMDPEFDEDVEDLSVDPGNVDKDAYLGALAGMALTGNYDLNRGNIRFNEQGEAALIDNDNAGLEQLTEQKVDRLGEKGSDYAADIGLQVDQQEVRDSIHDMADETDPETISKTVSDTAVDRMSSRNLDDLQTPSSDVDTDAQTDVSPMKFQQDRMKTQDASNTIATNIRSVRDRDIPSGSTSEGPNRSGGTTSSTSTDTDASAKTGDDSWDNEIEELSDELSLEPQEIQNRIDLHTKLQGMSRSEAIEYIRG